MFSISAEKKFTGRWEGQGWKVKRTISWQKICKTLVWMAEESYRPVFQRRYMSRAGQVNAWQHFSSPKLCSIHNAILLRLT